MPALENAQRFYAYVVRIDGRTRYVGKGCGRRSSVHLRASHNPVLRSEIEAARVIGKPVRVRIVSAHLSERDAYRLERRMIAKWSSRLANVSMGSHTDMERLAMQARANLDTLKTEEQVRREGDRMGVSGADRLRLLSDLRQRLGQLAMAA